MIAELNRWNKERRIVTKRGMIFLIDRGVACLFRVDLGLGCVLRGGVLEFLECEGTGVITKIDRRIFKDFKDF